MNKPKPILFNEPMVQAVKDDKKTQTRRLVRLPSAHKDYSFLGLEIDPCGVYRGSSEEVQLHGLFASFEDNGEDDNSGYYKSRYTYGDVLYIRETWLRIPGTTDYIYRADGLYNDPRTKWKPSIHMPKEAARLFIMLKDIRVERLNDITVEDIIAEGIDCDNSINNPDPATHEGIRNWNTGYAQMLYGDLWDKCTKSGDNWRNNPWVWVYEFERIEPPRGG